jgi:hypothetical protein
LVAQRVLALALGYEDLNDHDRLRLDRLYFSSLAYVLLCALRRLGLQGTELAKAQCGSSRLKLLKIGARIRVSVRRIRISFSQSYRGADLFAQVLRNLQSPPACSASP